MMRWLNQPQRCMQLLLGLSAAFWFTAPACAQSNQASAKQESSYEGMLAYLSANSRIDAQAFANSHGVIAINQASGDLNLQANSHSIAIGTIANAQIDQLQHHSNDISNSPLHAEASIGGNALREASGIVSINQASGGSNVELNSMQLTLAQQGIREASNEAMAASSAFASAGGQYVNRDPQATRKVAVEASALRGFAGVLQLNQVAGSGNGLENKISISIQGSP